MTPRHARPSRFGRSPRVLATAIGVVVTVSLGIGAVLGIGSPEGSDPVPRSAALSPARPTGDADPAASSTGTHGQAAEVLRDWDEARSSAYSRGSVAALRRLYVGGAGGSDVRLLRDYARRGLRVEQMAVQVLALEVLRQAAAEWVLRVTDRLSRGVAVGSSIRWVLPRDQASTRRVRLVRIGETWRVAAVRPG
ncbi:MAG: hypothetical protein H0V42_05985 [Nocardioidaceae bacterium]|nr:hypothetical protein [Nocardioidaceae bacterium]